MYAPPPPCDATTAEKPVKSETVKSRSSARVVTYMTSFGASIQSPKGLLKRAKYAGPPRWP